MKYFIDTEFNERPGLLELISIGIVDEYGNEFYAVSNEWKRRNCNDWVANNVLPYLEVDFSRWQSIAEIREGIVDFVDGSPEFWAYFADYDWVLFCWIFGRMIDLPNHFPMYCRDLKQEMDRLGVDRSQLPPNYEIHNALEDAKWIRDSYEFIMGNK